MLSNNAIVDNLDGYTLLGKLPMNWLLENTAYPRFWRYWSDGIVPEIILDDTSKKFNLFNDVEELNHDFGSRPVNELFPSTIYVALINDDNEDGKLPDVIID